MKEFWTYTALRLLLLLGTFIVVLLVWSLFTEGEVPLFWSVLVAFVLSGALSLVLLNRPRKAFAQRVENRAARASQRLEDIRAREDAD